MRLFVDECVYAVTTATLRLWGHDVETAQEAGLSGHDDEELLQYATSQNRVLISIDMDFSNALRFVPSSHSGIIILKIRPSTIDNVHHVLKQFFDHYTEDDAHHSLVIADQTKYRVRR
jgi:predicted nuclease of predicted toxin-antitoxin system